jgi:hypothetical protein
MARMLVLRQTRQSDLLRSEAAASHRHLRARRRVALLLLAVHLPVASGCTTWATVPSNGLPDPTPQEIQVWSSDSATLLQGPVIRGDSLIGTTPQSKVNDSGTRISRPIQDVDSVRVRKVSPSQTILAGIGVLGAIAFIAAVSGGLYGDQP